MFKPALRSVSFRPDMFEELPLAVNEQHVVQSYSSSEKVSEWQLLHKNAPAVSLREQRTGATGGMVRVTQEETKRELLSLLQRERGGVTRRG